MTTLSDLIARLEAAKEGSRELDAWVFCAVEHPDKKPERNLFYENREEWGVFITNAPAPGITFHDAPPYTTSLDAALTLVPEGYGAISASINERGLHSMRISHPYIFGTGTTSALALCIVALKAREAGR